ncbi:MAG TPA: adenylosuccinate lyase, partial [Bacteroidetes bacterium]|nr:adenylosuccinate lyase [Bacteroidota bacterium]
DAYRIVQNVAMKCWREKRSFENLLRNDSEVSKYLSDKDYKEIFNYEKSKRYVDFIFKRTGL